MRQELIAGIDIGGTKTSIMLARGAPVAELTLPTDSWRIRKVDPDARALADVVRKFCADEGLDAATLAALVVGAHGCDTDEQCRTFQAKLSGHLPGVIRVVNDSELMAPAAGRFGGIGVVAGTGSIAVARTAEGRMLVAGGWGWILGDEGSAPALVRDAAKAIRGALDAGERPDPLADALMQELGTDDPTMLGRLLNDTRSAVIWGRYANAVFAAADAGSTLARKVVADGGAALAALVGVLIRRGADASDVVAGGGVIVEQPRLMDEFRAAMTIVSPASRVFLLQAPPVTGALALAERALRLPQPADAGRP
ncbi:BadF/BadG/BcrA/BcrD ATPase family protein [Labrys monachus]|uniref:N-acetylglucosamine kinase-like BadF-type ATPase n=1 Tax=Labrys monachus TaxID=217067 RepID=A0ABU0FE97_9HYPH|nr:BadF/BadG/BcrA/BcrD ATPase family protein [Labrys monachus]MDQ0392930.1 N-acetylglucosamine kinase-like BadF-type ATPase [Labrys monachus]